jgi:hypothetical protein
MSFNIFEILEGWRNDLFPPEQLKEIIIKTQEERLSICKDCTHNSTNGKITAFSYCKDCGCPLKKKTACLSCNCPISKWDAIVTKEEDENIKKTINQIK